MAFTKSLAADELREKTLEIAKRHKASWIELGRHLYAIYKDKHYRSWDYADFDAYCAKELHIRPATAMKLLRSYYFLEKEEPEVLQAASSREGANQTVPGYESVNLLRLARNNKKLTSGDIQNLREAVLETEKEPKDVRTQMRKLLSQRDERDPREVRRERRNTAIKRLISILSNTKKELENEGLIPVYLLKQMSDLVVKLEDQLE